MIKKTYFFIIILFIVSLAVRIFDSTKLPPSLNWDEVSLGYNAYSILKTARDEWGTILPTIFRSYGDFKLPLYIYFSLPFIATFGLNIFSIRLLSILSGTLLPIAVFLLTRQVFKKNLLLPYIASLLVAFAPWSIFLSHIALEANLFLTLFIFSLYFLVKKNHSVSLILFALCLFTYNSARVLLPFYLISFFLYRPVEINIKSSVFFFVAILLLIYQTFFATTGQSRYKLVSLIDQGTINRIAMRRQSLPPLIGKIIHNKVTYFIAYSTQNYLKILDPRFVFLTGSSNYQFNIPNLPLFSWIFLPFYLIGLFLLIKNRNQLIYWFLVAPLPSAITRDAPHTLRAIVFLPLVLIITAYGLLVIKSKLLLPLLTIILLVLTFNFYHIFQQYSRDYSWVWQYGYTQVVDYLKTVPPSEPVYISKKYGEPHEFILFYWPINPSTYQNNANKSWNFHADWYWIDKYQNFTFLNDWEVIDKTSALQDGLLVTSPGNYPTHSILIKTIYYLDNKPAFDIVKL